MFALLVPGRPILPQPTTTHSQTQCSFTVPSSPPFSHMAIFLHPGQTLPLDTLAAVYIQIPPSTEFKLLGSISNEKQSVMYKVSLGREAQQSGSIEGVPEVKEEVMLDDATETPATQPPTDGAAADITVGISLEPAAQVQATLAAQSQSSAPSQPTMDDTLSTPDTAGVMPSGEMVKKLAQKIGQNAFNFLSSFAEAGAGGKEVVPIRAFQDWWSKFEGKVSRDPSFLLKEGDG